MVTSSSSTISSSHSGLSVHSGLPSRPSSSLSNTNTSRPQSSALHRPPSALSNRPISSASTRPHSRFSQRPNSRHARSRLIPFCQQLVTQITGLSEDSADGDRFKNALEYAVKHLDSTTLNKGATSKDMEVIDRHISGHALKARLNCNDTFSEALQETYLQLKSHVELNKDLDQDVPMSRLPDHMQFLLELCLPPTPSTLDLAQTYLERLRNPPPPPPALTWKDILAEEPFEGEHWEGVYGMPPGSVLSNTTRTKGEDNWDSTPSLSPLNSDDLALDEDASTSSLDYAEPLSPTGLPTASSTWTDKNRIPPHTYLHRQVFEELRAKQYWRPEWRSDAKPTRKFDIGDPSTLGPALENSFNHGGAGFSARAMLEHEKYIDEDDMVREILMALQGRNNIMLFWKDDSFSATVPTPRLIHLTLASQASIIASLARTATTVEHLRHFVSSIFVQSQNQMGQKTTGSANAQPAYGRKTNTTRTCEAFADAIDHEIRTLDTWCADREAAICLAYNGIASVDLVTSLLSLEKAMHDTFETSFEVLLDVVKLVFHVESKFDGASTFGVGRQPPAVLTALLLDTLFTSVQEHLERRDTVASDALMRVFVRTAGPVWGMIGRWLKNGMGLGLSVSGGKGVGRADDLDDEFFIESSGVGIGMMGMGLLDPEFWKEGYSLREGVIPFDDEDSCALQNKRAIPLFLQHVAELVLGAGKSVGLIRALGIPLSVDGFRDWRSFNELVGSEMPQSTGGVQDSGGLFSVSVDNLSRLIYEELLPRCQATGVLLANVLVEGCALWQHVEAIENLYLMRKGDAMSHFIDVLFVKMDAQQSWGDFHFLNTAFNDVVEANLGAGTQKWIRAPLVRFSYRSGNRDKDKTIIRTVKAIDGLLVEYAVPFPLTYIFRPRILQVYGDIFIFLLQIRRAKSVLERILVRGDNGKSKLRAELKVFYAMRSRFSWFINVLLNFLTTYVLHAQVQQFHDELRNAKSLDEIIQLHDDHLDKIQARCLLKPNTAALHRAILSILDMSLHFSNLFVAFAGDTTNTHDVSRQSISMTRHRSRRQRRQRKNIIGFASQPKEEESDDSSEDDNDELDARNPPEPSFSILASSVSTEDGFHDQVDKVSTELDGLVRFVRRGVDSLAGGTGKAAPAFGVLAFALEDWDI